MKIKKEVEELKEYNLAKELIDDGKRDKKRYFIMWIITFIGLVISLCYIFYLLHNIEEIETQTIEINDVESKEGSQIKIGNDLQKK